MASYCKFFLYLPSLIFLRLAENITQLEIQAEMIFVLGVLDLNPSCSQKVDLTLHGNWDSATAEFGGYVGGSKVIFIAPSGEFDANGCTAERMVRFDRPPSSEGIMPDKAL